MLTSLLAVLIVAYSLRERVKSGVPVSNTELTMLVNSDKAVVLDIRPSAEYKLGHLVDSINIPYDRINADMTTLEKYKSKTIIIVDRIGQYAGTAGRQLAKAGYDVRRLSGGISEWQGQNLPLVKGKQK
ncbi:MAG: rhodanese-like domain-containing protein [Gammaproteobacteria bacterium]|nr:MAG: rhodanese-like domain-containing protein [Gammaproteobacteria bacterium]